IRAIDLVCVNLYPFERTIARAGVTEEEAIEQIDIGGPSMIRSAAKNFESVTVITDPAQYQALDAELRANDGATTRKFRRSAAMMAFARTATYDTAISAWMSARARGGDRLAEYGGPVDGATSGAEPGAAEDAFPATLRAELSRHSLLRYGENPHQRAAAYIDPASNESSVLRAEIDAGKELSYNNLLDASAALELVDDLRRLAPGGVAACVVKHTNPCGAAIASTPRDAFLRAWEGDPLAAYGGIVASSGRIDAATAQLMVEGDRFLEVIVAPSFEPAAKEMLAKRWKNARLVAVGALGDHHAALRWRSISGGMLVQQADSHHEDPSRYQHAAGPAPSDSMRRDAAFAMTVVKHLKSNAVCITCDGRLGGAGAGQMDRVASCRLAIEKATAWRERRAESGAGSRGSGASADSGVLVAASDAFFPFPDGPKLLIDAGVRCVAHPGGSKRDDETFELCNERGVTCLVTGVRHFRH
ncbi:MAG: bifunctional phosphoribosylaminoimidazolecarboxamide formyltransferase/IMP cyclohydrolase, partial [Phycisphaerae bacterium]|nr:bifunctional phosphoribosylaminoimidazolecarboxamide formyltransferase/IMP cyclohydrolase [Phycisphaerae bacterium]